MTLPYLKKNENLDILCEVANHELSKVDAWLISNRLSLNVGKSSVMLFTNRPNNSLPINKIRSVPLNRVISTKFLGLIIDHRLTFSEHTLSITKKLSQALGMLTFSSPP